MNDYEQGVGVHWECRGIVLTTGLGSRRYH
jgi:hypothetical protein